MKIAILDRDGTLNQWGAQGFIGQPHEWVPVPGALEAVARLNRAGWHVVVATNQPGLGRGLFNVLELNAVHARMHRELAAAGARVEAVFYCPHAPDEGCACRKPGTALLEQVARRYRAENFEMWAVGATQEHLQAGKALGLHLVWLETAGRELQVSAEALPEGCLRVADMAAAVDALLSWTQS